MTEALALCVILFDEALGYGWLAGDEPAERLEAWEAGGEEMSRRLQGETGGEPALWLPALHEAQRAVDAMTGEEVLAALASCEEGA